MPGKQAFDEKLAELNELRGQPDSPAVIKQLRRALSDRSNYVVSKAAAITGERQTEELIPDLVQAFLRFFENPAKTDPQCWAKNALAQALKDRGHEDPALWIRGMAHHQPEPVWGGVQDTAATLRGTCALALVNCRSLSDLAILTRLVDLLADPETPARRDAARAIGALGRPEGALVLRTKIHCGDKEETVIGECFATLVHLDPKEGIPLVSRHLKSEDALCFEAAGALGESREPEAFEALRSAWENCADRGFRRALLIAIGATRQAAGTEFLLARIASEDQDAATALEALAPLRFREELRKRVQSAIRLTGSADLAAEFRKRFDGSPGETI